MKIIHLYGATKLIGATFQTTGQFNQFNPSFLIELTQPLIDLPLKIKIDFLSDGINRHRKFNRQIKNEIISTDVVIDIF